MIFGLERKADNPATPFALPERGHDVIRFHQMQIDRLTSLGDFVILTDSKQPRSKR